MAPWFVSLLQGSRGVWLFGMSTIVIFTITMISSIIALKVIAETKIKESEDENGIAVGTCLFIKESEDDENGIAVGTCLPIF